MKFFRLNLNRWPLVVAAFVLSALPVAAHEKWFVNPDEYHGAIPAMFQTPTTFGITAVLVAISVFAILWFVDRTYGGFGVSRGIQAFAERHRLNPRVILTTLMGVSLMGAGLQSTLFSPSLHLPDTTWGAALAVIEIALGTLLLFLEPIAIELGFLLACLYLFGFTVFPAPEMLEELLILGVAFYFISGPSARAPWRSFNTPERQRTGYQILRFLTGTSFLILASVKWTRPDLGIHLVGEYGINFVSGLGVDAATFVFFAALLETLIALAILLRVAFRAASLVALIFFTVSIYAFGFSELLGHLPIKAVLFLFLIEGHWHRDEVRSKA
jgi:uncharacterized membrane protein YphA (DoxX/SURF4 family)